MANFEPQRHDDGFLEVIGFTTASLVRHRLLTLSPAGTLYELQKKFFLDFEYCLDPNKDRRCFFI